jgi:hypothetical protein
MCVGVRMCIPSYVFVLACRKTCICIAVQRTCTLTPVSRQVCVLDFRGSLVVERLSSADYSSAEKARARQRLCQNVHMQEQTWARQWTIVSEMLFRSVFSHEREHTHETTPSTARTHMHALQKICELARARFHVHNHIHHTIPTPPRTRDHFRISHGLHPNLLQDRLQSRLCIRPQPR